MNFHKSISLFLILTMSVFLLTACKNETSYIHDQRGKSISVTSSDSDTYTFKLSGVQIQEESATEASEEILSSEPETPLEEPLPETIETGTEAAIPMEEPAAIGPKTGEP